MDSSDEDSIDVKFVNSKIDDKTYFILPKTVDQENERLVEMLNQTDDQCKVEFSFDNENSRQLNDNSIGFLKLNQIDDLMKSNENLIKSNESFGSTKMNITKLKLTDSLMLDDSICNQSADLNQSNSQLSEILNLSDSKKTKLSDDEQQDDITPKKMKTNSSTNSNSKLDNSQPKLDDNQVKINNKGSDARQTNYKAGSSHDGKPKCNTDSTMTNGKTTESTGIKINTNTDNKIKSVNDKTSFTTTFSGLKKIINNNNLASSVNNMNSNQKKKKDKQPKTNTASLVHISPGRNQSVWDRLDNPEKDDTLKYLYYNDIKPNKTTNIYGKDGKSLKKSPKIIDPRSASRIVSPKETIKTKTDTIIRPVARQTNDNKPTTNSTPKTGLRLTSSHQQQLNNSNGSTMGEDYERKVQKLIDEELNFLDDEVKIKVANRISGLIKEAVCEGVKTAFDNGLLKIKEQFNTKKYSSTYSTVNNQTNRRTSILQSTGDRNLRSNSLDNDEKENNK